MKKNIKQGRKIKMSMERKAGFHRLRQGRLTLDEHGGCLKKSYLSHDPQEAIDNLCRERLCEGDGPAWSRNSKEAGVAASY